MIQFARQKQRLTRSKKNKQWKMDNVKYLCSQAENFWNTEYQRMYGNYQFYHNILNQADFQKFCDPLNLDMGTGRDYVQAFNKAPSKINVLMGEEQDRPWRYQV